MNWPADDRKVPTLDYEEKRLWFEAQMFEIFPAKPPFYTLMGTVPPAQGPEQQLAAIHGYFTHLPNYPLIRSMLPPTRRRGRLNLNLGTPNLSFAA
jgi:hypothetical protein